MYKNFTFTESEREEILNRHKDHGYRQPINEQDGGFKEGPGDPQTNEYDHWQDVRIQLIDSGFKNNTNKNMEQYGTSHSLSYGGHNDGVNVLWNKPNNAPWSYIVWVGKNERMKTFPLGGTNNSSKMASKQVIKYALSLMSLVGKKPMNEQSNEINYYYTGTILQAKRNVDNQIYTLKIVANYGDGESMVRVKGPGTYNGKPLDGNTGFPMNTKVKGTLVGDSETGIGTFTVVKQLNESTDVENMINAEVIDKDIVKLPPNDLFDPNVYGSYHYYKAIHYKNKLGMSAGIESPIAYYKIADPQIVDVVRNAKFNKGDGHQIKHGHWFFNKKNPNEIILYAEGTGQPRKGMLGAVADRLSQNKEAIGTIPTPKGILNFGQLQWGRSWFWDNGMTNLFFEFQTAKEQSNEYIRIMQEVIKDTPDPDPDAPKPAPSLANTLHEGKQELINTFNKFVL